VVLLNKIEQRRLRPHASSRLISLKSNSVGMSQFHSNHTGIDAITLTIKAKANMAKAA